MLNDYHMLYQDEESVRQMLSGVVSILDWFKYRIDETGLVTTPEYWNFVDWVEEAWDSGVPTGVLEGQSSIVNLLFVYGMQKAIDLFRYYELNDLANEYENFQEK